jgi:hypothetical protein
MRAVISFRLSRQDGVGSTPVNGFGLHRCGDEDRHQARSDLTEEDAHYRLTDAQTASVFQSQPLPVCGPALMDVVDTVCVRLVDNTSDIERAWACKHRVVSGCHRRPASLQRDSDGVAAVLVIARSRKG